MRQNKQRAKFNTRMKKIECKKNTEKKRIKLGKILN